jgi:hypothetical protein
MVNLKQAPLNARAASSMAEQPTFNRQRRSSTLRRPTPAPLAQWTERLPSKQQVTGPNPLRST